MTSPEGEERRIEIHDLCVAAQERARNLGHPLGSWRDHSEGSAIARRATCTVCGAVAYVRIEGGLAGAAGEACTEPCPGGGSSSHAEPTAEPAAPDAGTALRA